MAVVIEERASRLAWPPINYPACLYPVWFGGLKAYTIVDVADTKPVLVHCAFIGRGVNKASCS